MPEDLDIILNSIHCWEWFINHEIQSSLHKARLRIDEITSFHTFPTHRLKAESKKGKRLYVLQKLSLPYLYPKMGRYYQNTQDTATKAKSLLERREEYFFRIIRRGSSLKYNQWLFVKKYIIKNKSLRGYNLPLKEDQYYTWKEITDILSTR